LSFSSPDFSATSRYNQILALWNTIAGGMKWLVPRTRVARFTAYLGGINLVLLLLKWTFGRFGAAGMAASLGEWTGLLGFVLSVLLVFLGLRWFRNHVMWSVRNRLIVTYLFIGGVPVTLALVLALGTGYVATEHLATFLATAEMRSQEQRLGAANTAAAELIVRRGMTPEQINAADTVFPGRSITVLPQGAAPEWLKDGFTGLVADQGRLSLRAANTIVTQRGSAMVVSSVAFDQKFLERIAGTLGPLTLSNVSINTGKGPTTTNAEIEPNFDLRGQSPALSAGSLTPPKGGFDQEFHFGGLIQTVDWATGEPNAHFLAGITRPSAIFSNLSASMGLWTGVIGFVLFGVAVLFAIVVLVALLIGIRLTRTITYSVANLYKATEHINRGDFTHRIKVRQKDQLGALQTAFNSMTESLERLIAEQKEKERLQSELEIAHEVQSQLFPHSGLGTRTLELSGTCRPARIVSGDYYDFISYNPEQIGIAVGDISGKGISAALLMATIHSAVRAYEQEQALPMGAASEFGRERDSRIATLAQRIVRPSPAHMLRLLNRHLYQTTQPEKYATLFLGFYDDEQRRLTYSNAGHLPPIILGEDGSTRRLDVGGTVVGLFDGMEYQEQTVQLQPGDLFIAFSDGMTEPENDFGEFGEERLVETISAYRNQPLDRLTEHAVSAVQDWIGAQEQPDDVTLVLARRVA
jgi:sigma-B regulation protein RsbU (phosphoserine phosphatase)